MLNPNLESFLHPRLPRGKLPTTGSELYAILDSGNSTKEQVGAVVRDRYADTASLLDSRLYSKAAQLHDPVDLIPLIGQIGAFNYIRGMSVIKKDGTIDREVAPKIMLSPSAAIQVLDQANLTTQSRVLEMFSGVGYFSFFLALQQPARLDCVDIQTPEIYDLDATFKGAYYWVYSGLSEESKPKVTTPAFRQIDCQNLVTGDSGIASDYTHVFLHPPYGRQSKLLMDLPEEDCKVLWLNSLNQAARKNQTNLRTFSVVPSEWAKDMQVPNGHTSASVLDLRETRMFPLVLITTEVKK